ncbi:MAG TPA: alpha/beta hydrolase [Acidimicrobiales bacterium]|nr:alpha/beta hydrolase [Acidimicrobiales bacterium]
MTSARRWGDYRFSPDHVPDDRLLPVLKSFAGGRLFGASYGDGLPWVLALHGWMRTHRDFDGLFDGIDAIAVDLPGFGATPPPPEAWSTAQYAEWLAPLLDEMGPDPVILGHSFGGRVAVHLAATYPDRIGALVLSAVPRLVPDDTHRRRPALAFRVGQALRRTKLIGEDRMETIRHRYGSADYRAARGVMRDVLVKAVNETYGRQLAAFPGPIELVWGERDDVAPIAVAELALEACADGRLVSLPGVGHFTPQQAPDELRAAVTRHRSTSAP